MFLNVFQMLQQSHIFIYDLSILNCRAKTHSLTYFQPKNWKSDSVELFRTKMIYIIHNKNGGKLCSHCGTAVSQALSPCVTDQALWCDVTQPRHNQGLPITNGMVECCCIVSDNDWCDVTGTHTGSKAGRTWQDTQGRPGTVRTTKRSNGGTYLVCLLSFHSFFIY